MSDVSSAMPVADGSMGGAMGARGVADGAAAGARRVTTRIGAPSPTAASATAATDVASYLASVAHRLGAARALLVAVGDADKVASAIGAAEVVAALGGTPVRVADLRAHAARKDPGNVLVVDVTAATTHGCAACRLGADVACAEVGEGACVVGIARGTERLVPGIDARLARLGAPSTDVAAAVVAADRAARARWHATSDAAAVIASYLRCHPAIAAVRYPGLKDDPSFGLAARTLTGGFGATVSYATAADPTTWRCVHATEDDPRTQVMALERLLASLG